MSSKQQLIEQIVHLLLTQFEPYSVSTKDRAFLEQQSTEYLKNKLQELVDESADPLAKDKEALRRAEQVLIIFKHSGLKNNKQNATELDRTLPGATLSFQNFRSLIEQNSDIATRFTWDSQPFGSVIAHEQEQSKQRTKVRQAFSAAALAVTAQGLNDVGDFDSNLRLVCSVLGTDFTVAQAVRALTDGSIQGLAASGNAAELREQYRQKLVDDHNKSLLNSDTDTLRKIVRRESAETLVANQQARADRELQVELSRDAAIGFPTLPDMWRGEKLDSAFIKKCNPETHKLLSQRFGSGQLTNRLRGN
jgi:hypothetical protein